MSTLSVLFDQYSSDKNREHSYGQFYDDLFSSLKTSVKNFLEIGVLHGASLFAWQDFFPYAQITGLDHWSDAVSGPRITTVKADSQKSDEVHNAFIKSSVVTPFDIIVDDGGHWISEQLATWHVMKKYLRPGGIYVIEDIQNVFEATPTFVPLGFDMVDRRGVKGRGDDVLAVYRKDL